MAEIENKTMAENQAQDAKNNADIENEQKPMTLEQMQVAFAKMQAENAKLHNAVTRANGEAANYKKPLREKMTADEQRAEAENEARQAEQERIKSLEDFQKKTLAEKRYIASGMTLEQASRAAEAEISNDYESLAMINKEVTDAIVKQKQAEWLKSRPSVNMSSSDDVSVTRKQYDAWGYRKKVEFKQKYPEAYKRMKEGN